MADFLAIKRQLPRDKDYPDRQFEISALTRVLEGDLYDHLKYSFDVEFDDETDDKYVPISQRRPSVRTGLCSFVVDESVALLFSEGHFPTPDCEDENTLEALKAVIKEATLNVTMIEAATWGSVGSVAVFLRILKNDAGMYRCFFKARQTEFLTPTWKENEPDQLQKVREQRKITGQDVRDLGYKIKDSDLDTKFWFAREWDDKAEIWFIPWRVTPEMDEKNVPTGDDFNKPNRVDKSKTVDHALGFVPVVWVKNLPGGDDTDGTCTFEAAIDTMIEMDYLASQGGRGLKYSSDPLLVVNKPEDEGAPITKSSASALALPEGGDAKLLEITGDASNALRDWIEMLRKIALESVHGNRADPEKLSSAQSGRAMELMHQSLIWLADKLRISYGEGALLSLLHMICEASAKYPLTIDGKQYKNMNCDTLSLKWAPWFAPTNQDKNLIATTLKTHTDAGHMSRETAVGVIAPIYDVEDQEAEISAIEAEIQERLEQAQDTQVKETINA